MVIKIRSNHVGFEKRRESIVRWKVPEAVKTDVRRFLVELDMGKVNRGRKISLGRQVKYIDMLKVPLQYFNKPIDVLLESDVEQFEKALSTNQIRSRFHGREYAHATKVDIRKALKIFLRWRLGEAQAIHLAGWLDTRAQEKTPEYLKETEVEQLFRRCRTSAQRYMIAVLFDAGARAEEFLNIRYEDVHLPEGKDNFVKIALREEFSKTKGRTISLYWHRSLEAVTDYLKERIQEGIVPQDPVFQDSYDAMRFFLRRLGLATLKRPVHPHLFRHSSATYYATKMNRQELCYRYGWRFSSNMPDIYISRAGMENKELDVRFTNTELGGLKTEMAAIEQAAKIKDDRILKLEKTLADLQQNFSTIAAIMATKPTVAQVEAALARKKKSRAVPGK